VLQSESPPSYIMIDAWLRDIEVIMEDQRWLAMQMSQSSLHNLSVLHRRTQMREQYNSEKTGINRVAHFRNQRAKDWVVCDIIPKNCPKSSCWSLVMCTIVDFVIFILTLDTELANGWTGRACRGAWPIVSHRQDNMSHPNQPLLKLITPACLLHLWIQSFLNGDCQ